jgi:nucleotidyltransferase/DNA polymerase involved in DNA repair
MELSKKLNIIHLDMDAFYASVEEKDNPRLRGRPVIVGGLNNRGIVTTANYEARKYGIHSAMPIYIARKKCPKGCFVPTRIERYKEVSGEIFKILYSFTDLIEPLSIDEAYMDISDIKKEPLRVAMEIKKKVMETTSLTMSVGISYNKFLAKLASDWNKPDGIKIITEDMVPGILLPLSVKSVHGIGPRSSEKLNNIGIYTVGDLLMLSEEFLTDFFGKAGIDIYNRIRGIDNRKINTERKRSENAIKTAYGSLFCLLTSTFFQRHQWNPPKNLPVLLNSPVHSTLNGPLYGRNHYLPLIIESNSGFPLSYYYILLNCLSDPTHSFGLYDYAPIYLLTCVIFNIIPLYYKNMILNVTK